MQSALQRLLGLTIDGPVMKTREEGVAEMMVDVYSRYAEPLNHETLCHWHGRLLSHDRLLEMAGAYRRRSALIQIDSGRIDRQPVQFEAPPSSQVSDAMTRFVACFNGTAPDGATPIAALTQAALGHLWFASIHPFADGNGRLGRALTKNLSLR